MKRGFELSESDASVLSTASIGISILKTCSKARHLLRRLRACGLCLLLPRSCRGCLLCFRFELDYMLCSRKVRTNRGLLITSSGVIPVRWKM